MAKKGYKSTNRIRREAKRRQKRKNISGAYITPTKLTVVEKPKRVIKANIPRTKQYHKRNLAKARAAKQRKRLAHKAGGAKRTKIYQQLKKKGITADIGTEGMTVSTTTGKKIININRPITGGYQTYSPLSPHHKKDLIYPDKEFSDRTKLIRKLQGGYMSTAIESFEYIPEQRTLKITFWKIKIRNYKIVSRTAGSTYLFMPVSFTVYTNFLKASSKGRYFYYQIRPQYKKAGRYRYKKIG